MVNGPLPARCFNICMACVRGMSVLYVCVLQRMPTDSVVLGMRTVAQSIPSVYLLAHMCLDWAFRCYCKEVLPLVVCCGSLAFWSPFAVHIGKANRWRLCDRVASEFITSPLGVFYGGLRALCAAGGKTARESAQRACCFGIKNVMAFRR